MSQISPEALLHVRMQMEIGSSDIFFEEPFTISSLPKPSRITTAEKQALETDSPIPVQTKASPKSPEAPHQGERLLVVPESSSASIDESLIALENANSLEQLYDAMIQHPFYRLAPGKPGRIAFGQGPQHSTLMLIGDWPTEEELRVGGLYGGAAGELLRKLLDNLHYSRNLCFATWLCKKPLIKAPLPRQAIQLRKMLQREIQLLQPKMILLLGEQTFRLVMQKNGDLVNDWGQGLEFAGIPTVAIASPREMLDDPRKKALTWNEHIPRSGLFRKKAP